MHQFNSVKPLAYRCSAHRCSAHKRRSVGSHRMSMAPTEVTCFNPHALFCSFRANATSIRKSVAIDFWNLMPCAIAGAFTRPTPKNNDLFQRLCLWQSYCRVMPLHRSVFFFVSGPHRVLSGVAASSRLIQMQHCYCALRISNEQMCLQEICLKTRAAKTIFSLTKIALLTPQAPFLDMFAEHILATRT